MGSRGHTVTFDGRRFRTVLGHFPTGVAAITATSPDGSPVGLAVGSFTSVSLDPPLVAFLPDKGSSSFPKIRDAGAFCVNVLASDQEVVCRQFAASGTDKFAGLSWTPTPTNSPRLEGVVAWIDCEIADVIDAGDHYIVLGRVRDLDVTNAELPLLFFQGGYGSFRPSTIVASPEAAVARQLRWADLARPEMQRIADELDLGCLAASVVGDEMLILASTGRPGSDASPTQVGQRIPFVAPFGALWLAWDDDSNAFESWIRPAGTPPISAKPRKEYQGALARVRERGWSIGLGDETHSKVEELLTSNAAAPTVNDPQVIELSQKLGSRYEPAEISENERYDVRNLTVPVRDGDGHIVITLTVHSFPHRLYREEIERYVERLIEAADRVAASGLDHAFPAC